MEVHDLNELADAELTADLRARAKAELQQIARESKKALAEAGCKATLFFLVPNTGASILAFGTPGDPTLDEWERISEIVSAITRLSVGLEQTRCREVVCASTDDQLTSMEA